ncbi:MAG: UDP-N-acetylmuramate--L-alanine ligase [Deltaproteobacteria bacterium CG11_big_fil_rev_8_21_14_0_20_47_16]|nr:MAG: UDP-N-acetylmuramate--L-alanine ligase [Deltaproteobacteria bacterium CG11_big_fil_rev_8_21_14_0_20_47_16]
MFKWVKKIHFVGIGGIGMSGIAEVLLNLGYKVSGSDLKEGDATKRLRRHGAKIMLGHRRRNVTDADVVVISSAVASGNPELVEARSRNIPIVRRAEMLAELMRLKYGIAVAGTHGKTSTTSMVGAVLSRGGLSPTMVIGGKVNALRSNAKLGKGEFLVAEADESDRSFLHLTPTIAVITNIDPEHMENYRNFDHMRQAYLDFANKVPFYGVVVACMDHPEVRRLIPKMTRRTVTYGLETPADYVAKNLRQVKDLNTFTVFENGKKLGVVRLKMPGRHNVSNALAAIAVGRSLGISFSRIAQGLAAFRGVERRFQVLSHKGPVVVSDYAHHPAELEAAIQAARAGWPGWRLIAVHQPHRYSRLKQLFPDFVKVLARADKVAVMKLYAAGEAAIPNVSAKKLHDAIRRKVARKMVPYSDNVEDMLMALKQSARPRDIILFMGAGDIWKVSKEFTMRCL